MTPQLDAIDRAIINRMQDGLEICDEPFAAPARDIGITVAELLSRLEHLKAKGILSRVGPMYDAARMGGGLSLCAMEVPEEDFERVAALVNSLPQVAHNYQRAHRFNMWFVLATEDPEGVETTLAEIESLTGVKAVNLPKLDEYFIGMKIEA